MLLLAPSPQYMGTNPEKSQYPGHYIALTQPCVRAHWTWISVVGVGGGFRSDEVHMLMRLGDGGLHKVK